MVKQPLNKQVKQRYPTDEDVAMRCSAQSDHAGSAADPEWEAVLAQQIAEEAEEEELCRRFEHGSDDGWDYSEEEEEDGHAAVQGVAGKVNEPLEERDESARVTGGGFSMPQAAPTSMGYHSCDCIEEGFNIQQTGIEGDRVSASDVSSVPIVTNQSQPSSQISACADPESSAAPSRARRASAASTSAAPASKRSRRAAKKESKKRVPQAAARFDAHRITRIRPRRARCAAAREGGYSPPDRGRRGYAVPVAVRASA